MKKTVCALLCAALAVTLAVLWFRREGSKSGPVPRRLVLRNRRRRLMKLACTCGSGACTKGTAPAV